MSSDGYFDDELDSAFLNEVEAIDAAAQSSRPASTHPPIAKPAPAASKPTPAPHTVINVDDSYDFDDWDEADIRVFDQICQEESAQGGRPPAAHSVAGPSRLPLARAPSKTMQQTTLFGDFLPRGSAAGGTKPPSSSTVKPASQRTTLDFHIPRAGKPRKTKQWDHTAFAKSGKPKAAPRKDKGKARQDDVDEQEDEDEEPVEFEQFPAPFVPTGPPPPMKLAPDLLAARRWIYPLNQPKREYQYNIVKHCLYENTLVALPTGLGKTFVAGVVMLNFYTWFPEGKVVFVAPTKPLVAQQIEACHKSCGIPGTHAVELTGQNPRAVRARAWREKRVFYMTPQTLMNDLRTDNCDPRDIVLLVIDEAHKGTGDYAYAQVIRYLMAKNPHHRVLALTATPGGNPETVQKIVDALHISNIEIRDEESLDLRAYTHKKHVEQHCIEMSPDIVKLRDLLVDVMNPIIKRLNDCGVLRGYNIDAVALHPYRCTAAQRELSQRKDSQQWAYKPLSTLGTLARAMGYLLEASVGMCYSCIESEFGTGSKPISTSTSNKKAPAKTSRGSKLQDEPAFIAFRKELETQKSRGFAVHPKMEKLKTLLIGHFAKQQFDAEEAAENGGDPPVADGSRAMVFVSFREAVGEVVQMLNEESPLIRATKFIGQGTDKQGGKGFAQRDQLETIKRFKAGEFNVLVSTSIGEEGLDIGEIDVIVCYDAQKTPIRMLQRVGRTGRKRDGYVHVLLAQGREEQNWAKAQENHAEVQRFIVRNEHLELYDDVPRLLPEHIKPESVEMMMEIEEHVREDPKLRKASSAKSPKAKKLKRNEDVMRNIPAGASTGFVSVKDLLQKGASKKRKKADRELEVDLMAGEDDEDDLEIEAGIHGPRRTVSTSAAIKESKKKKPRRAATTAGGPEKKTKSGGKKKSKPLDELTGSQLERMGGDDSDDLEIERGLFANGTTSRTNGKTRRKTPSPPRHSPSPRTYTSSPEIPIMDQVIDLTTPDLRPRPVSPIYRLSSSPLRPFTVSRSVTRFSAEVPSNQSSQPPLSPTVSSRSKSAGAPHEDASMAWLIADDDDPDVLLLRSSPPKGLPPKNAAHDSDDEVQIVEHLPSTPSKAPEDGSSSPILAPRSPPTRSTSQHRMPPPALPTRSVSSTMDADESFPALTFAVRAPGKQAKKRCIVDTIDSSPLAMPPSSQRRLQRQHHSPSPPPQHSPPKKKRKFRDIVEAQRHNPWMDVEAYHSGDERSQGSSDGDALFGSESDQQFLEELPETQVSPSYNQAAIYRQSLLTQATSRQGGGPVFANRPIRRGGAFHAYNERPAARSALASTSSSPKRDDEPDEYAFGSFVVDDDADISYMD